MFVHIPALRGKMGTRTYYACLMPLEAILNMFKFDPEERQWTDLSPEQREQRALNKSRVPALTAYILDNEEDYLFASITASYKSDPIFVSSPQPDGSDNIGTLKLKMGDELTINDGQHRCAGIVEAVKKNPELGGQTISVLLFPWESTTRVQQMFTDLNRHVVKTSKSLDVLFDKRDPVSIATMFALDKVPVFKDLTEKVDASLKSKSTKIFTLAALYDANSDLLKEQDEDDVEGNTLRLVEYWTAVAGHMVDWGKVLKGQKMATELRAETIAAHSTVLRALGGLGSELMKSNDWKEKLAGLEAIDWSKTNPDWQDVCIVAHSVVSNRQARAATKAYIKGRLGMEMTDAEIRSIKKAAEDTNGRDASKATLNRSKAPHLNEKWAIGAAQARYSDDGHWYATLSLFPAALIDAHGYVRFETEQAYLNSPHLNIGKQISVRKPGISAIPGYVLVDESDETARLDVN